MLQRRATTKAEDEPICLATLMDIPLEPFSGQPSMHQILGVLETVPKGLIFIPGPRMTIRGFRWASRSFLNQRSSQITGSLKALKDDATPSTLIDRGIQVFKPSISFLRGFNVSEQFTEFAKSGIRIGSAAGYSIRASVDLDKSCSQLSPSYLNSAAVIFERDEPPPGQHVTHAILVGNVEKEEDKAYCHYEGAVTLSWPIDLFDNGTMEILEEVYEGPKTWSID